MGPRASLDSGKSRPTGIRSPDRPARSSVSIPTELPGRHISKVSSKIIPLIYDYILFSDFRTKIL
jgi:hypothetical protein